MANSALSLRDLIVKLDERWERAQEYAAEQSSAEGEPDIIDEFSTHWKIMALTTSVPQNGNPTPNNTSTDVHRAIGNSPPNPTDNDAMDLYASGENHAHSPEQPKRSVSHDPAMTAPQQYVNQHRSPSGHPPQPVQPDTV
ncbi:unnamed protein product [Heligmosomoides polygyrus]|uniref:Uncharacterized protein n=1 Tax=Heligmosomoides polygyrus TaxID=6339 RepID=A0A183FBJ0_HELPZ|nr:unnamed protein product [Heligmosomoides polygyrus]